jgi:hypothetical protein
MSRKNQEQNYDYAESGMSIWQAMLDRGKKRPKNERGPVTIRWGDKIVQTADVIQVPRRGMVRLECVRSATDLRQGFDVKMRGGCVLANGEIVPLLRTWCDERYEPVVEYNYEADSGLISTWNVYETWRGSELTTEKWTGNAGFWIEEVGTLDRIYHCSAGPLETPGFESLVYRMTVTGAAD